MEINKIFTKNIRRAFNKIHSEYKKLWHSLGYATPTGLTLFLSRRCNSRCPHCQWLLYNKDFFSNHEINLGKAREILLYFKARYRLSILSLHSEGEVLLYDEYRELVKFAREIGYQNINSTTNGLLLHKYVDFMLEHLNHIGISLDGYNPETYNLHRGGNETTFNRVIDNIKLLTYRRRDKKVSITVNCVIGKFNLDYIKPMIKLAEELKIDCMRFGAYHPTDGKTDRWIPLYYGDKEVEDYYHRITSNTGWKINISLPSLYGNRNKFWCSMLFDGVQIGSKGSFSPCCHIPTDDKYRNFFISPTGFNEGESVLFRRKFITAKNYKELPPPCSECPRLSPVRYKFSAKDKKWRV